MDGEKINIWMHRSWNKYGKLLPAESRLWDSIVHFSPPPSTFKIFRKFHNKTGKNIGCPAFTILMLILMMMKLT